MVNRKTTPLTLPSTLLTSMLSSRGFVFFTIATNLLRGTTDEPTAEERREARQHVAFYNYVQEFVGDAGRIRPTRAMWRDAATVLEEVVAELRPDVIFGVGLSDVGSLTGTAGNMGLRQASLRRNVLR
nr:hypothetical protein [Escherichia coli]